MNRSLALGVGVLATALAWEVLARLGTLGPSFASLSSVVAYAFAPEHRAILGDATARTGAEALAGLVAGGGAGIAIAALGIIVPPLGPGLAWFASIVNGIPILAVAGVCVLALPRDATPSVVAALAAAFVVFVAATAGLATAPSAERDLFRVLGAARSATLARLLAPRALPPLIAGIRAAAPSAVVGAIVGEWFAAERGLGPQLFAAMQNYQIAQLWASALAGAMLAIVAYALLGLLAGVIEERFA